MASFSGLYAASRSEFRGAGPGLSGRDVGCVAYALPRCVPVAQSFFAPARPRSWARPSWKWLCELRFQIRHSFEEAATCWTEDDRGGSSGPVVDGMGEEWPEMGRGQMLESGKRVEHSEEQHRVAAPPRDGRLRPETGGAAVAGRGGYVLRSHGR